MAPHPLMMVADTVDVAATIHGASLDGSRERPIRALATVGLKIAGKSNIVGDDAWSQLRGGR